MTIRRMIMGTRRRHRRGRQRVMYRRKTLVVPRLLLCLLHRSGVTGRITIIPNVVDQPSLGRSRTLDLLALVL